MAVKSGGAEVVEELQQLITGPVRVQEPLARHTTFRIGGPAAVLVEPQGVAELQAVVRLAAHRGLPVLVMGNGSNLLVRDGGWPGLVIKIAGGLSYAAVAGTTITAGAGFPLPRLARFALQHGLSGFEFMVGIPGTVGGAVVMNAGANGAEVAQVVERVKIVLTDGTICELRKSELSFAYRRAFLPPGSIIAEVIMSGFPAPPEEIAQKMSRYLEKRKNSQPLEWPSAGSVFKNPPGMAAGRLIEEAGGKGLRVGDAMVSTKHANFIVNLGRATAGEVLQLIDLVRERVREKFGVELELEVKVVGEDAAGREVTAEDGVLTGERGNSP